MTKAIKLARGFVGRSSILRDCIIGSVLVSLWLSPLQTAAPLQTRSVGSALPAKSKKDDKLVQNYGKLPLNFEPNVGQSEGSTKFIAHSAQGDIYLTSNEIVLNLLRPSARRVSDSADLASAGKTSARGYHHATRSTASVVRLELKNSHVKRIIGCEEQSGSIDYFIGNNPKEWRTGIHTYRKVKYEGVYPGIDQIFYGNGEQLEYDFVVAPTANPSAIRLALKGRGKLTIDDTGDLVVRTDAAQAMRLHQPFAYQAIDGIKHEVSAGYVLMSNNEVAISVGNYDRRKPLVIDPVLSYSTYLGGDGNDAGFDIAVDGNGSTYITGSTDSTEFSPAGGSNAFVAKLSPDGTQRVYMAIIGGTGDDVGFGIAVDSAGGAYITGATNSTDFPVSGAFQSVFGGGSQDAFVAKLSPDGSTLAYASYFGGSGNDSGFAISVDSKGSAYVAGSTDSAELSTLGNTDAFVTKLNPAGNTRLYSSILGGSGDDTAFDIAVDGQGEAFIVGATDSTDFKTANALQPNFGGSQDAFIAKLSDDGSSMLYSTYLGGAGNDSAYGIALDSSGSAYITGSTDSPEYTALGGRDAFVAKLNSAGDQRTYFTILGGSGDDVGFGIAVDGSGNAYVTGSSDSSNFTTANSLQANQGGSQDAFVAKLNSLGSTLDYSTLVGRSGNESGFAVSVDASGSALITGFTNSTDFPLVSPFQGANAGGGDVFVLKISTASISSVVQLGSSTFSANENAGFATINVARSGDISTAASVVYATANGTAREGRDYMAAQGVLNFAAGETSKSFPILIIDNAFVDGSRTVNLNLSNPNGAVLSTQSTAVLTINDNDVSTGSNPLDAARSFVQANYYDFLGRYPDQSGWDFWTNQITACGTSTSCTEVTRINTSGAFFLSIEFQQTGYLVERMYKTAYGDAAGNSGFGGAHQLPVPIVRFGEFLKDTQRIGQGVIVNQTGWEQQLENNKQTYANEFVQTQRFRSTFPTTMTAAQFVDKLNQNAGNVLSATDRTTAINLFGGAADSSNITARAQAVRQVAENAQLASSEKNRAFVLSQYFGYLRRDPNSGPDSDYTGFDFWLNKLNQFNGNFIAAEMVKAFISSSEYRQRFGP